MKNEQYLNLCLEQAAKASGPKISSLHFRHGSVVVKGGKVVGQGFNAYRPGYDGGALKTGQLPTAAFPFDDAISDIKRPLKSKHDDTAPRESTFIPFEQVSGGGGRSVNTCLTMHSEMMAINSALSASSTLAASAVSHIKPCFKLPNRGKKQGLLRSGAVGAYVERVCLEGMGQEVQQGTGPSSGQEWRFETGAFGRDGSSEGETESDVEPGSEQPQAQEWEQDE
ncbi:hypothetical protein OQA88_3522 [Cercophora sp. LCS_1]